MVLAEGVALARLAAMLLLVLAETAEAGHLQA